MIPPRENPSLIGHAAAEAAILSALASGRLPHAWLLLGPKGIGKATLAFRFARHLLANPEAADTGPGLFGETEPAAAPATRNPKCMRFMDRNNSIPMRQKSSLRT